MQSLDRKLALRASSQVAVAALGASRALARTGQVARSSLELADGDVRIDEALSSAADTTDTVSGHEGELEGSRDVADGVVDVLPGMSEDAWWAEDVGQVAADGADWAAEFAAELDVELEAAKVDLERSLVEAHEALTEAGFARGEAAQAVVDAQRAVADAGVALGEAVAAAQAASQASVQAQLADGRLTLSDAQPVAADGAGKPDGALWMRRVAGAVDEMWEWTASGWVSRPLAESIIPKVAIGAGTYGELDGERLTANEGLLRNLYTNRIVVSASDFAPGPGGYEAAWTLGASASFTTNDSLDTSGRGIRVDRDGSDDDRTALGPMLPVVSGQTIQVALRGTYVGTANTGGWRVEFRWYDRAGSQIPPTVVHEVAANATIDKQVTVPPGAVHGRLALFAEARASGSDGDRVFRSFTAKPLVGGELIVDGAILAKHVSALAITAEKLAAGAVTAVKIAANAVTAEKIMAGSVATDKLAALAVTADKVAAGAIVADKIAAGAIITSKLAATAIDGMTITGALIRTAPSGRRLQLDANGLRSFNSGNTVTATLSSADGGLSLDGNMYVKSSITSHAREIALGDGAFRSYLTHTVSGKSVLDQLSLSIGTTGAALISERYLGATGGPPLTISAPKIILSGAVEFQGDVDWTNISTPGATGTCQWMRKAGIIYFRFDLTYSTAIGAGATKDPVCRLPAAAAPGPIDVPLALRGSGLFPLSGSVTGDGVCAIRNTHTGATSRIFGAGSWPAND